MATKTVSKYETQANIRNSFLGVPWQAKRK
jgi:hypothetical protein